MAATQRGYHCDELKKSSHLKIGIRASAALRFELTRTFQTTNGIFSIRFIRLFLAFASLLLEPIRRLLPIVSVGEIKTVGCFY